MSTASLSTRLKKLQAEDDGGLSLEQWAALGAKNISSLPRHALFSICVEKLIPRALAVAALGHPLFVAWLKERQDVERTPFVDWLVDRGTSLDAVLEEVQRDLGAR
jgi:hypothetical protein